MTIESSLTFLLAIFIFGITPGPGVFAILSRALLSGASACFSLALGMVISDIIYLVLACYGLAALAEHWSEAFTVVRIAGAGYLIYLGVKMWRATRQQNHSEIGLMVGLMMIAIVASSTRRYIHSPRGQKALNRASGGIMIGAGAYLASNS
jgi:threonine/homoserine/homoserine lactone efflux protein